MREIKPLNNNGSIQLKFSVNGKRYSFNPGGSYSSKRDLANANATATKIYNDVLAGVFDPSLCRYKSAKYQPPPKPPSPDLSLLDLWDKWVDTLDLAKATKADHYEMIRRMIVKATCKLSEATWLTEAKIAPSTFNKRLGYVKSCFRWAIAEGLIEVSPFEKLKSRKAVKPEIRPFTLSEIKSIIAQFDCSFPHYAPFVTFLLSTGVRTSEAIGLQWKHINLERNEILICESLPKDRTGNGYSRIRKATKTGSVRYLTMTQDISTMLLKLNPAEADDLVFKSAKGCVIDAGNFREDWKEVLSKLGIPYRKPYTTRHTLLSIAIDQGVPITGVAYIAGHSDTRMVMQTYGHLINRPVLPKLFT